MELSERVRALRQRPGLRRVGIPLYIAARRLTASGVCAPILINSIPKAGTHLLSSILGKIPRVRYSGIVTYHDKYSSMPASVEGNWPDYAIDALLADLRRVEPGNFANGHLYWDATTEDALDDLGFKVVFMIRDPRDILVSNVHYIASFRAHPSHDSFVRRFPDFDSRLMALILGYPESDGERGLAPLGDRLEKYAGWLQSNHVFRYEDFVGSGSRQKVVDECQRLANAIGLGDDELADRMVSGIGDRWSATFRSGESGTWGKWFRPEHLEALKHVAEDQFTTLGYSLDP